MQGICDIFLEVMPTGPAEVFRVKLDVPEFTPLEAGTDKRGASGNSVPCGWPIMGEAGSDRARRSAWRSRSPGVHDYAPGSDRLGTGCA